MPKTTGIVILLLVPGVLLAIAAGCNRSTTPSRPAAVLSREAEFVGSDACTGCHTKESDRHNGSGHAHSMWAIGTAGAGAAAPPLGRIPNSHLEIERVEYRYAVSHRESGNFFPLQYAVGSGKQGTTYVGIPDSRTLFEMRWSYFPSARKWYMTPGQEQFKRDARGLGISLSGATPRACILCHAVTLAEDSLYPEPRFLGVGCESCHGAGSAHVASARISRGKVVHLDDLSKIGGKRMNSLCGRCHRDTDEVMKLPAGQRISQRFFPYGLAKSRCFQKTDDRMTCSTCHDPHTKVSTDRPAYEARCLSCHSGSIHGSAEDTGRLKHAICPINPRIGCVGCHMPKRDAFPNTDLPIKMADHWIRADRGKGKWGNGEMGR